jgi:hypothetical protein
MFISVETIGISNQYNFKNKTLSLYAMLLENEVILSLWKQF